MIIAACWNDRNGMSSSAAFPESNDAVDDAALITARKLVVGIVPLTSSSLCSHSRIIGIIVTLRDLKLTEKMTFVDPYDHCLRKSNLIQ